jgi:predicted nucleic acid-binding Zn ribbon protein
LVFCSSCGKEIPNNENFCTFCGSGTKNDYYHKKREPVFIWYGLATLFGILGGIIGLLVMRNDNPPAAKNCLIIGIVSTIISIMILAVVM